MDTGIRSAALWWIMSDSSSLNGGGVPEMLAKVQRGDQSSAPRWERFAMRLVVGHLLAYNVPGLDRVCLCLYFPSLVSVLKVCACLFFVTHVLS